MVLESTNLPPDHSEMGGAGDTALGYEVQCKGGDILFLIPGGQALGT